MATNALNTTSITYRQLIGNGLQYIIPPFQRDYSWTEEQWDDLWQDLHEAEHDTDELRSDTEAHYMGYLVLQSVDGKVLTVIDGQQRLTTLSLLVLAALKCLRDLVGEGVDSDKNALRESQLRGAYIGFLDPVSLSTKSKLKLNRNNDKIYQDYLVPLVPAPRRGLKPSEHLLRKGFEWFYDHIKHKYASHKQGSSIAQFIESVSDRLIFTQIVVGDELNAYRVFETLNARGVKLSSSDLLKNFLFSIVGSSSSSLNQEDVTQLENYWTQINEKLKEDEFPEFLRAYWNSKHRLARHSELFKRLKGKVHSRDEVFALLNELRAIADTYAALRKPEDELWNEAEKEPLRVLKLFNVRQQIPMLLAARTHLPESDFVRLLWACVNLCFRFNIIANRNPNEMESVYNQISIAITEGRLKGAADTIRELQPLYIPDPEFKDLFKVKTLVAHKRSNAIVRYILASLETHCGNPTLDINSKRISLEHILPENPDAGWSHITEATQEQCVHRLGNYVLLSDSDNRRAGNQAYSAKRGIYAKSIYKLAQRVANEFDEWNDTNLASHQGWMAKQAAAIWRIAELS